MFLPTDITVPDFASSWDFTGDRAPRYEILLTDDVLQRLDGCADTEQALLERYAELNPGFRPLMEEAAMREAFRRAYVLDAVNRFDLPITASTASSPGNGMSSLSA